MIRSILFDLDQKISHLASTRIRNKILGLFSAFMADPLAVCLFAFLAEMSTMEIETIFISIITLDAEVG